MAMTKRKDSTPDWAKLDLDAPDAITDALIMDVDKIYPTPAGEKGWKVPLRRKVDHMAHVELTRQIQEAAARGLGVNGTGVLQPILIRRTDDPNRFYITAGGRRWRAVKEAGLTKIPAIIRDQTSVDAYESGIVENFLREGVTIADNAAALLNWMAEADISIREMARRTGKSAAAISTALGVVKDPVLSKAVEDGKVTPSQARELLYAPGKARLKLVDSVSERRTAGVSVPLPQLRQEVKEAQSAVMLHNTAPITGGHTQGTYAPRQPQIDPVDLMLKVCSGAQAVAAALPSLMNREHLYKSELRTLVARTRAALDEIERVGQGQK